MCNGGRDPGPSSELGIRELRSRHPVIGRGRSLTSCVPNVPRVRCVRPVPSRSPITVRGRSPPPAAGAAPRWASSNAIYESGVGGDAAHWTESLLASAPRASEAATDCRRGRSRDGGRSGAVAGAARWRRPRPDVTPRGGGGFSSITLPPAR